jgi:hypothetical protein
MAVDTTQQEKYVIDQSVQDFLESGIEYKYPGKWKNIYPGASVIDADGVGILVVHNREDGLLAFAAGVLGGVDFSSELVRDLGRLNSSIVLGSYVLSEGQPGYWSIRFGIKLLYQWIDESDTSAHMIGTALNAVPAFVNRGIAELSPNHGGERWETHEGWFLTVMDNF